MLLCAGRTGNVVRYSLAGASAPLAVADYTYNTLPPAVRAGVPTDGELLAAVTPERPDLPGEDADVDDDRPEDDR